MAASYPLPTNKVSGDSGFVTDINQAYTDINDLHSRLSAAETELGGFHTGTGSPEGVVTAGIGARYVDTAATLGAVEWVKVNGSGNTGWTVVSGNTGSRNISSLLANGWTGSISIARHLNLCRLKIEGLNASTATSNVAITDTSAATYLGGFVNPLSRLFAYTTADVFKRIDFGSDVGLVMPGYSASHTYYAEHVIALDSGTNWPSSLPGA